MSKITNDDLAAFVDWLPEAAPVANQYGKPWGRTYLGARLFDMGLNFWADQYPDDVREAFRVFGQYQDATIHDRQLESVAGRLADLERAVEGKPTLAQARARVFGALGGAAARLVEQERADGETPPADGGGESDIDAAIRQRVERMAELLRGMETDDGGPVLTPPKEGRWQKAGLNMPNFDRLAVLFADPDMPLDFTFLSADEMAFLARHLSRIVDRIGATE